MHYGEGGLLMAAVMAMGVLVFALTVGLALTVYATGRVAPSGIPWPGAGGTSRRRRGCSRCGSPWERSTPRSLPRGG